MLHREVDVDALRVACDLDAVAERRDRAMRPAAAAVLGEMLVTIPGTVVDAVFVTPRELVREVRHERCEVVRMRGVLALNPVGTLSLQVPNGAALRAI